VLPKTRSHTRSVALPLEGLDVLHKFTPVPATLAVQLLDVGAPKRCTAAAAAGGSGGAGSGGSIFDPPLGELLWHLWGCVAAQIAEPAALFCTTLLSKRPVT
jgi:hypothetical protein